jgi:hypothetical protein
MARDPRGGSAFDSGMRGKQKANSGGDSRTTQKPGGKVGNPGGEAFSSGMRGGEKPKQKATPDEGATLATGDQAGAGSSHQAPGSSIGVPKGQDTSTSIAAAMGGKQLQAHTADAHDADASTEQASQGHEPSFTEDDTHVNIRVPKSSFKRHGK